MAYVDGISQSWQSQAKSRGNDHIELSEFSAFPLHNVSLRLHSTGLLEEGDINHYLEPIGM